MSGLGNSRRTFDLHSGIGRAPGSQLNGGRGRQAETIRAPNEPWSRPVCRFHLEDLRMPAGATLSIHELEAHMAKLIDPATGQFPVAGDSEHMLMLWQISRRAYK